MEFLGGNYDNALLWQLLAFVLSLALFFSHQIENKKLRCGELQNTNYNNRICARNIFR